MHFEDRIDAALNGVGPFAGKVYFFRDGTYLRYDWKTDREDFGHPLGMSTWHPPERLLTGLDAAVNGFGDLAGKAYFFKGNRYDRYDWNSDRFDLVDQDIALWRLPDRFLGGVDAALEGRGPFAGKTYFFKDDLYVAYNWRTDAAEAVSRLSAWNLPGDFGIGVGAAVNGGGDFADFAHFFRGPWYARYQWSSDSPSPGYPHPIAGDWKHGVAVWVQIDTANNVGSDARLLEADNSTLSRLPLPPGEHPGSGRLGHRPDLRQPQQPLPAAHDRAGRRAELRLREPLPGLRTAKAGPALPARDQRPR
jgi:hypothetical protein